MGIAVSESGTVSADDPAVLEELNQTSFSSYIPISDYRSTINVSCAGALRSVLNWSLEHSDVPMELAPYYAFNT
jgi:hypothetical protein